MLVIVDVGDSVAIDSITKLGRQLASHAGKEETRSGRMTRWRITLPLPFHAVETKKAPVA